MTTKLERALIEQRNYLAEVIIRMTLGDEFEYMDHPQEIRDLINKIAAEKYT